MLPPKEDVSVCLFITLVRTYERLVTYIRLFHFLSVQGDGRKIPGLVKSMNFQRSTAKSPKIPGSWQHFATKFIEIEIFTLTDFSRARKEKKIFSRG